jgi:hypothetical protein
MLYGNIAVFDRKSLSSQAVFNEAVGGTSNNDIRLLRCAPAHALSTR